MNKIFYVLIALLLSSILIFGVSADDDYNSELIPETDGIDSGIVSYFNVSFNGNSAEGTMNPVIVSSEFQVPESEFIVPDDYVFDSWNLESDGSGSSYSVGDIIEVNSDIVLFAQWRSIAVSIDGEAPEEIPTDEPAETPTEAPEEIPTDEPAETPTEAPEEIPTDEPTEIPTAAPEEIPTDAPAETPAEVPVVNSIAASSHVEAESVKPLYVPDRVFVKYDPNYVRTLSSAEEILEDYYELVPGLQLIKLPAGVTVEEAIEYYSSLDGVIYAEPDYYVSLSDTDFQYYPAESTVKSGNSDIHAYSTQPNDPFIYDQWGLDNIDAYSAWDITTGSSKVVVAVLDTGINYNHEDLKGNMWTKSGYYGYNCVDKNNYPLDDHGHGTHCAGIIGAVGNNGVGVTGVAWDVSLMAVKVLGADGRGANDWVIRGIDYANKNGADVISLSLGGPGDPTTSKAYNDAISASSAVVVCAAGNDGTNNDDTPHYPSSCTSPNIIAVAASDPYDYKADFSNYGLNSVDVAAPGTYILSTYGDWYAYMSGTSQATPMVSGIAALILSQNPSLPHQKVISAIENTVDKNSALIGMISTGGRVNAYNALKSVSPVKPTPTPTKPTPTPTKPAPTPTPVNAKKIEISNNPTSMSVGQSVVLDSKVYDTSNKVIEGATVTWTTSSAKIASIDENGLVTAKGKGTATITASYGKIKSSVKISVVSPVTEIVISGPDSVSVRDKITLKASVSPSSATNKKVTWSSSDTKIATVTSSGSVTGINRGTVIIKAVASDGMGAEDSYTVTVTPQAKKIEISNNPVSMTVDQEVTLKAEVLDTSNQAIDEATVTWTTSSARIASIDDNGLVTAKGKGTATITASYGKIKSSVKISVVSPVTEIVISGPDSVSVRDKITLKASVSPSSATNKKVTWSSSDTKIATVTSAGSVTGINRGTVTIKAVASDGMGAEDSYTVTVTPQAKKIEISNNPVSMTVDQEVTLKAEVLDTSNQAIDEATVTWTTSSARIASIDDNGLVTAKGKGTATITASYGKIKSAVKISVVSPVTEIVISGPDSVSVRDKITLKASVSPSSATNKKVTWSSSDTKIATVTSSGSVTGVNKGTVIIKAVASDGMGAEDSYTITVTPQAKKIEISNNPVSMTVDQEVTLKAEVLDTSNQAIDEATVTWTTSSARIASIDENGLVTAKGKGTATITASYGKIKSAVKISVVSPVTEIVISGPDSVSVRDKITLKASVSPSSATNKKVTWSSSDTKIATVTSAGSVTGVNKGTVIIKAVASDGMGAEDSYTITVTPQAKKIEISNNPVSMTVDQEVTLKAEVLDTSDLVIEGATVTWTTSSARIASIDDNGLVTAKGKGTATITASYGKIKSSVRISVTSTEANDDITEPNTIAAVYKKHTRLR